MLLQLYCFLSCSGMSYVARCALLAGLVALCALAVFASLLARDGKLSVFSVDVLLQVSRPKLSTQNPAAPSHGFCRAEYRRLNAFQLVTNPVFAM